MDFLVCCTECWQVFLQVQSFVHLEKSPVGGKAVDVACANSNSIKDVQGLLPSNDVALAWESKIRTFLHAADSDLKPELE